MQHVLLQVLACMLGWTVSAGSGQPGQGSKLLPIHCHPQNRGGCASSGPHPRRLQCCLPWLRPRPWHRRGCCAPPHPSGARPSSTQSLKNARWPRSRISRRRRQQPRPTPCSAEAPHLLVPSRWSHWWPESPMAGPGGAREGTLGRTHSGQGDVRGCGAAPVSCTHHLEAPVGYEAGRYDDEGAGNDEPEPPHGEVWQRSSGTPHLLLVHLR